MSNIPLTPPTPFSGNRLKFEYNQWLTEAHSWDITATLTTKEHTAEWQATSDLSHFWNVLDRQAYGEASKKGTRIKRICLIDRGANNTNIHFHIVALTPTNAKWTTDEFCQVLSKTWQERYHAGHRNIIEPIRSVGGCIGYLSGKLKTNTDQLDLNFSHL